MDLEELVNGEASVEPVALDNGAASDPAPAPLSEAPTQEEVLPADSDDPFIGGYTPQAPAAAVVEPKEEDPRVAWRKKNADVLKEKDTVEAKEKKAATEKAAAHLKKVSEARAKSLAGRKDTNRKAQTDTPEAGVPTAGTTWEKVVALVNFSAGSVPHHKDVTRLKNTLVSLKTVKATVA